MTLFSYKQPWFEGDFAYKPIALEALFAGVIKQALLPKSDFLAGLGPSEEALDLTERNGNWSDYPIGRDDLAVISVSSYGGRALRPSPWKRLPGRHRRFLWQPGLRGHPRGTLRLSERVRLPGHRPGGGHRRAFDRPGNRRRAARRGVCRASRRAWKGNPGQGRGRQRREAGPSREPALQKGRQKPGLFSVFLPFQASTSPSTIEEKKSFSK